MPSNNNATQHSVEEQNSDLEIPETDDDDDDIPIGKRRTTRHNLLSDSEDDQASDEEDKKRKSMYEAESDEEANHTPIEDKAYSKATRKSIHGFAPRKSMAPASDSSDDDETESIIVEDSDEEQEGGKEESTRGLLNEAAEESMDRSNANQTADESGDNEGGNSVSGDESSTKATPNSTAHINESSVSGKDSSTQKASNSSVPEVEEPAESRDNSISSDMANKSVEMKPIRSPLKELNRNNRSISNESFNSSIIKKMSSTLSAREAEDMLLDEAAGGLAVKKEVTQSQESFEVVEKIKVSPAQFREEKIEKEKLEQQVLSMNKGLEMAKHLPDGGQMLRVKIDYLVKQIEIKRQLLLSWEIDENKSIKKEIARSFQSEHSNSAISIDEDSVEEVKAASLAQGYSNFRVDDVKPVHFGKRGMENFLNKKALTVEKLDDLKSDIDCRPAETVFAAPPKYLKVELMPHQLHAIEFMMWRETRQPRGGILADDMGLGKTLTALSLVMKGIQKDEEDGESDEDSEDEGRDEHWKARGRKDVIPGGKFYNSYAMISSSKILIFPGTLVVCPASLLKQWEHEIQTKTKRGAIEQYVFHGPKREYKAKRLAKYDVVLTTYQVVVVEEKSNGCLFQVKWKRIILDEGHVIRNHKAKQSEAICKLPGKFRWVLTGTPIHNKEFDLYACVKFLKCTPFDDLTYWKQWIEPKGKGESSSPRIQALLKAIMLRRTKQQLIEAGEIKSLPNKIYKQFNVTLNPTERTVYNNFLAKSQSLFATYVKQQQDKHDDGGERYDHKRLDRLFKNFSERYRVDHEVKAHEILTVILRLRQICCHPGLAKNGLQNTDLAGDAVGDDEADVSDALLQQLENLNIAEVAEGVDDQVFNLDMPSSKLNHMMEVLRDHIFKSEDKAIIVSQWTSYLNVVRGMLEMEGVKFCELNGTVPVNSRNDIVVSFNDKRSGTKVMLLSLTAGGVGLNLVGANYLFLMDLHWNPQLEQQAQDRIYRFGQKKEVNVFK